MVLEGFVITHEGKIRSHNEDNFLLFGRYREDLKKNRDSLWKSNRSQLAVAAVLDGMGGEDCGEMAARTAASDLYPMPLERGDITVSIRKINKNVRDFADSMKKTSTGTTAAILFFDNARVLPCNVGDSRAYLFRENRLQLLTHDHSEGQRMIDMGILPEEQARENRNWHILTQYLGVDPEEFVIEPYYGALEDVKKGDIFILCSDGLTDMLSDEKICSAVCEEKEKYQKQKGIFKTKLLKMITDRLLQEALQQGGNDNTTIMSIEVKSV